MNKNLKLLISIAVLLLIASACSPKPEPQTPKTTEPQVKETTVGPWISETAKPTATLPVLQNQYQISQQEEKNFFNNLSLNFSADDMVLIKSDLEELKKNYPEGYFIVVKVGQKTLKDFKKFYDKTQEPPSARMNLLTHELIRAGSQLCFLDGKDVIENCGLSVEERERKGFLYKNLAIILNKSYSQILFTKDELRAFVANTGEMSKEIDDLYLKKDMGDLGDSINELNAYTHSMELAAAYKDNPKMLSNEYLNLLRQIYHIQLYLQFAKSYKPEVYNALAADKAWAVVLYKTRINAEIALLNSGFDENKITLDQNILDDIEKTKDEIANFNPMFIEFIMKADIGEMGGYSWYQIKLNGLSVKEIR